jgi:hypothetical protein
VAEEEEWPLLDAAALVVESADGDPDGDLDGELA